MNSVIRKAMRLAYARLPLALAFLLIFGTAGIESQAPRPAETQSFEVASVRPNKSEGASSLSSLSGVRTLPGGTVIATNMPLHTLIEFAYGLDVLYERVEGKSSLLNQNFDVNAKAAGDVPRGEFRKVGPVNLMMRNLLIDRFKLVVRLEERSQQGYALVRAKPDGSLGAGIRPSDLKCPRESGPTPGDTRNCAIIISDNELRADGHDMGALARAFAVQLRRPVVDRTGVSGVHEIRMKFDQFSLAEFSGLRPNVPLEARSSLPSVFTALQEQLGLKLEPQNVPARVLIVERVEPPSEN